MDDGRRKRLDGCILFSAAVWLLTGFVLRWMYGWLGVFATAGWYPLLLLLALLFCRLDRLSPAELRLSRRQFPRQLLWGAAGAAGLLLLFVGMPALFGVGPDRLLGPAAPDRGILFVNLAVYLLLVGPAEELAARGYLLGGLSAAFGSRLWGAVVSSALFGLWHLASGGSWVQAGCTAAIGLLLALPVSYLPGFTLLSAAAAHGLYDAGLELLRWFFC